MKVYFEELEPERFDMVLTHGDEINLPGIDGIYYDNINNRYVFVEAKEILHGKPAKIRFPERKIGQQFSDTWLKNNIRASNLDQATKDALEDAIDSGNYDKTLIGYQHKMPEERLFSDTTLQGLEDVKGQAKNMNVVMFYG